MRKIDKRTILISSLIIALILFLAISLMEKIAVDALNQNSEFMYQTMSKNQALTFEKGLERVETSALELSNYVAENFDMQRFKTEDDYLDKLEDSLDSVVRRIAVEAVASKSAYVFFAPELDQKVHDIWYADLNKDGEVERQASFSLDYFDGDVKWKQWYYVPVNTKKPYWTEPYVGTVESDQGIIYFSYTMPIIVEGKVIGVVGCDYYYNDIKKDLDEETDFGNSETILVDQNFNILLHSNIPQGINLIEYQNGYFKEEVEVIQNSKSGRLNYKDRNGVERILYYTQLKNGWYSLLSFYEHDKAGPLNAMKIAKWVIFGLGMLLVIIILSVNRSKRYLYQTAIKEKIRLLLNNDFNTVLSNSAAVEKSDYADVNVMLEQLRTHLLESSNREQYSHVELEEKVEEKINELTRMNEYLEISLAQMQEQNAELNIANEKLEDQMKKVQLLQNRLFQSEQLASLTYILVGLAYDLNSPIGNSTTMISYLKSERAVLLRKLKDNLLKKNDLDDFMNTVGESLDLMERNMQIASSQVVQFKRLSSGNNRHLDSEFKLKEVLASIFNQSTQGAVHDHIRLNLNVPDLKVECDLGAFIQVFSSLINYSLNFSYYQTSKGLIYISCEVIDRDTLVFSYEDYGKPTPDYVVATAFVPHLTTTFEDSAQTIQLNICYHIIARIFGGSIKVEKNLEEGNKFYMIMKMNLVD